MGQVVTLRKYKNIVLFAHEISIVFLQSFFLNIVLWLYVVKDETKYFNNRRNRLGSPSPFIAFVGLF